MGSGGSPSPSRRLRRPRPVLGGTPPTRRLAEQHRRETPSKATDPAHRLSTEEIIAIVEELGDIVNALRDAEPEHKLDVYRNLGLRLTYDPETRTVLADIDLATHRRDLARVRRSTQTNTPLVPILELDLTLA
jgi:hypothetical protein